MANANGWGDGASNNNIGWGKGADNAIGWGDIHADSWAGATDIVGTPAFDPDAQTFFTAASITDPTQQSAINQLVVDLKGYGVWTKMKALYPFCGSTASQHKWNLKDPRDLDVAFRLQFFGDTTHSINGVQFGGVNGYADTKVNAFNNLSLNSTHFSVYSRTNSSGNKRDIGAHANPEGSALILNLGGLTYYKVNSTIGNYLTIANSNSQGNYMSNRTASNVITGWKNGVKVATGSNASSSLLNAPIYFGAIWENGGASYFSDRQYAFASIGDGLSDTEAANFYTAVQAFQVTLGRSIGTQTVSDADAQAFVTNAGIVDQVEANAVNNLVIGLKADGLWSKMSAIYPMVGGSSSTMKYNLKNPLDTDAAFRLVFNGGLTYSSTGLLGGVNGYADTKLSPSTSLSLNNTHISFYSRTDTSTTENVEMGINDNSNNSRLFIAPKFSGSNTAYRAVNSAQAGPGASPNMQGFFIASRVNSTAMKLYRNASVLFNDSTTSGVLNSSNIFLLCYNSSGTPLYYTDRECAFASIGDGLDDTEATNLNSRVTTFQTALNRNV